MKVTSRPARRSTLGGFIHSGVVLTLLLAIATLALVVTPPAPPGIAEFAPRATETIDEALKQQASQFGAGDGGPCAAGQGCTMGGSGTTTTTTTPRANGLVEPTRPTPEVEENQVKRCVGSPARQTEDPQSPPCKNFWEGDNGGATSRGVTAQDIKVAYFPSADPSTSALKRLVVHFNTRYQFYGRKITLVPVSAADPAAAAIAADEVQPFAALDFSLENITLNAPAREPYYRGLASRRIIGIAGQPRRFTQAEIKAMSPYYWSYEPGIETVLRHTAALACALHGRPARHGSADVQGRTRKFAVVFERMSDNSIPPLDVLDEGLARCSARADRYEVAPGVDRNARAQALKDAGVTTVIMVALAGTVTGEMEGHRYRAYEPELLLSGYARGQHEAQFQLYGDPARTSHMFGVAPFNKLNPLGDEPAAWAESEGAPDEQTNSTHGDEFYTWYHALLVLASGIQMAGPHLTPTTFAEGLATAKFPNPGAGAAPYWQARVGFGPNDYSMVDDVTAVWWSETAPSYRGTRPTAGWCYVDRGARLASPTQWPADIDSRLLQGTCR